MIALRLMIAATALALAGFAAAQDGERGSVPPGQSRDGGAPSDGAIKGGTILPGENAGVPNDTKVPTRCDQLSGTLREDCLKQERNAGIGDTKEPTDTLPSRPVIAPPQNPR
jgi:hypothetical protein